MGRRVVEQDKWMEGNPRREARERRTEGEMVVVVVVVEEGLMVEPNQDERGQVRLRE